MRNWTIDEARAYLPRLRLLLGVIRRAAHLAVSARGNGHATLPGAPSPAGTDPPATAARSPRPVEPGADAVADAEPEPPVAFDAEEALQELDEHGIVLRDPDRGLIDFPTVHCGREVLLCWQLGEDDLGWWHFPEDGFAGRRPLPLPPEL
ncbi:MAG TPA: DUF2203 domain-containing protein [Acidimicrobiales bacterium]